MDLLDAILIALIAVFAYSGFRRGFSYVGASMIGLLAGLLMGALLAPPIARALTHDHQVQPVVAIGFFLAVTLIAQGIGTGIGFRARLHTVRTKFAELDSALGSMLSVIGVLAGTWYLGLIFSQSPWVGLDDQISGSAILRALDSFVPRPPGFLGAVEHIVRNSNFPKP